MHRVPPSLAYSTLSVIVVSLAALLAMYAKAFAPSTQTGSVVHETKTAPVQPTSAGVVTGVAFGDIMLDRYIETLQQRYGKTYPFDGLQNILAGHDIVFANLEGPIVTDHHQTANDSLRFSFPPSTGTLLKQIGFTTLSVANNHGADYGNAGIVTTRNVLAGAGLDAVGNPIAVDPAMVVRKTINGQKLIFVGFHATQSSFPVDKAVALIQSLAQEHATIIVSIHWGVEYQVHSNAFQQSLAHKLVDAGADMILGQHPHVVQEVEVYNNRAIFYSLGNLVFDQYFSDDTQQELGVEFTLSDRNIIYFLLPLQSVKSQPRLMTTQERGVFLQKLADRSDPGLVHQILVGTFSLPK